MNEGLELKTKLDNLITFHGKQYPLWGFVGEDLDELVDDKGQASEIKFTSFSNDLFA